MKIILIAHRAWAIQIKKAHGEDLFIEREQENIKNAHWEDLAVPIKGSCLSQIGGLLKFVFLTQEFYDDYANCYEIEKKINRPYTMFLIKIDNINYAIPFRSNITHPHVFWTDKANGCGLDFSKTVVVNKRSYLDTSRKPYIRPNEFKKLEGKKFFIKQKLLKYMTDYKKALADRDEPYNNILCSLSALQYFHNEIGIIE